MLSEPPGYITVGGFAESVVANTADAKKGWLASALEYSTIIEEPVAWYDYSGQLKLRMPKSMHRRLAEHSRKEGSSMKQYHAYLLSKNDLLEKLQ